ncbi:MAG: hypothetical protein AB7R55_01200 [Gemmatimonadales bacterium]
MKRDSWSSGRPDEELGALLRERLAGPDDDGFLDRMGRLLRELPESASQWDVLATWARPSVLAAAMAAAFLLGAALYVNWGRRPAVSAATVPAAALMAPTGSDIGPITFAVMEGR